ncbi:MAG: monovalent cation/H+ antiporter complex subunit F [Pseudomonadota bacterium]
MSLLVLSAEAASWIVLIAALITTARLVLGPGVSDRAVALDLLTALVAAFAGLRALVTDIDAYLDVAAALALVGFLGTLAFARFIAKRGPRPGEFEKRARLRLRKRS